ncbi:MAG: flavodoxin family protein [Methanomicrobiales archaeon]|nr:flavodoxin family protein [Methanomicrobiales archaeon]
MNEPVRVLGLLGSPLSDGNTARLLASALAGVREAGGEVERVDVPTLEFSACEEIMYCRDNDTCWIEDAVRPMYRSVADLDGVIIATPIMTMGIPGKLKSFMDRFQVFFMAKYMRKVSLVPAARRNRRRGVFISICGMDGEHIFAGAKTSVEAFFDIIDVQYHDELLVSGMDRIQDIRIRPDLLSAAHAKGRDLVLSINSQALLTRQDQ